jgi:hypothetical protein
MRSRTILGVAFVVLLTHIFAFTATGETRFYVDGSIESGEIHGNVYVHDLAVVDVRGGYMYDIDTSDSSTVNMSGGDMVYFWLNHESEVNFGGGASTNIYVYQTAVLNLMGGSVPGYVYVKDSGVVNMTDGHVGQLRLVDSGTLNMSGGTAHEYLRATHSSKVNIHGLDLLASDTGGNWGGGFVSGLWGDGTPFSIDLVGETYDHVNLITIPEPATLGFLSLGGLALSRKRRQV